VYLLICSIPDILYVSPFPPHKKIERETTRETLGLSHLKWLTLGQSKPQVILLIKIAKAVLTLLWSETTTTTFIYKAPFT